MRYSGDSWFHKPAGANQYNASRRTLRGDAGRINALKVIGIAEYKAFVDMGVVGELGGKI